MAPERIPPIARIHQTELSQTARPMIPPLVFRFGFGFKKQMGQESKQKELPKLPKAAAMR